MGYLYSFFVVVGFFGGTLKKSTLMTHLKQKGTGSIWNLEARGIKGKA